MLYSSWGYFGGALHAVLRQNGCRQYNRIQLQWSKPLQGVSEYVLTLQAEIGKESNGS